MNTYNLPYDYDPEKLFSKLSQLSGCVWLDSGKPKSTLGRYDIISALPCDTIKGASKDLTQDINKRLKKYPIQSKLPFCGGWIGYISYEGEARFSWYEWAIIIDHKLKTSTVFFLNTCPKCTHNKVLSLLQKPLLPAPEYQCRPFKREQTRKSYLSSINAIHAYLNAGDCYQVNYTQRFQSSFEGSSSSAYRRLRKAVPSPFSAYIPTDDGAILCISPERFIQIIKRDSLTQPIKGTTARGKCPHSDIEQKIALQNSKKDLAENVMIVDLLRNDFNRHCEPFSVKADKLFEVQSFANVHHLVSTITGTLKQNIPHLDFLLSCFPGGSITGAPKKRAMEIIKQLEPHSRSVYCGSIGYLSCNEHSDFNIAIRTLEITGSDIHGWAGGGIVLDSDAEHEYQESLDKIERLLKAIETSSTRPESL